MGTPFVLLPKRSHVAPLIMGLLLVSLALALTPALVDRLQAASGYAGTTGPLPDYGSALLLALLLMISIAAWPLPRGDRRRLLLLWGVKAALTLFLLPLYEVHYNGGLDAYMYFRVGALAQGQMPPFLFGAGTSVMIWVTHWVTLVLPAYFHLLEMLWSFIGLLGVYAFYRGWRWLVPQLDSRFLLWIGLFPGVLFWTSIFGKDPVCLLGVGLYFCGIARWHATGAARSVWLAALGIVIAMAIRSWYLVILVAPLVAFAVVGRRMRGWQKLVVFAAVVVGAVFAAQSFLTRFDINDVSSLVATSNSISHSWTYGGSALQTAQFHGLAGMLTFMPFGMFTAFFRPLPGEILAGPAILAGIENVVLLAAFIGALWRLPLRRAMRRPWLVWAVLVLAVWGVMYAFPSSQNLGTAVRFKLEMLPILWPLVLLGATRKARRGLVSLRANVMCAAWSRERDKARWARPT